MARARESHPLQASTPLSASRQASRQSEASFYKSSACLCPPGEEMQQQDWEEKHDQRDIGNALEKLQHGNLFLRILAAAFSAMPMLSPAPDRNKDIPKR